MVKSIIYISRAGDSIFEEAIQLMLLQARIFNRRNGITGCLLYHQGYFIQLMEGEKEQLDRLYDRIQEDARHTDVTTLWEGYSEDHLYRAWTMAYHDCLEETEEVRYNERLLEAFYDLAVETPGNKKVMKIFREVTENLIHDQAEKLFAA